MTTVIGSWLPRLPERLVDTPRLKARLDEWCPVTIVRGPPGHGKTTLVASWVEQLPPDDVTTVWVSASPSVGVRQTFDACLSQELGAAGLAVTDSEAGAHGIGGLGRLHEVLLQRQNQKLLLVIDNFHHVRDKTILQELLSVVEWHRHFYLYVCCRGRHQFESMIGSAVKVSTIDATDLRFNVDEIREFAQTLGISIDDAAAAELYDAVWGNTTILRTLLLGPQNSKSASVAVQGYLWTTLVPALDDESYLEHLMRISLADVVEWRMFRDLCDADRPDLLLTELEATGLLEWEVTQGQVQFCIPGPIRTVLRDMYRTRDAAGARAFHRRLAGWYAEHDGPQPFRAMRHAVEGEDWELMDQIWSSCVSSPLDMDVELLRGIVDAVPATVLANRPSMQVVREVIQVVDSNAGTGGAQTIMDAYSEACERAMKVKLDSLSLSELLFLGTGYLVHLRNSGRFQDAVALGDFLHGRAKELTKSQNVPASRFGWFHLQRGISYTMLDDHRAAKPSYQKATEQSEMSTNPVASAAAGNMALALVIEGEVERARVWLARHQRFEGTQRSFDILNVGGHIAAGILALDQLDEVEVEHQLECLGGELMCGELWPFAAFLYAQSALHSNRHAEGLLRLDEIRADREKDLSRGGVAIALITRARADLLIACRQGRQARNVLEGPIGANPLNRVPRARLRLLCDTDSAELFIDPLTWDAATSVRDRMEMLTMHAEAALRRNDVRNAQRLINQALEMYGETRILRPFATVSRGNLTQLLELADQGLDADDLERLQRLGAPYPEHLSIVELSKRELSVLAALADHNSRQDIADSLFVSVNTVKSQLASIYKKLGTSDREETLAKARTMGFLP